MGLRHAVVTMVARDDLPDGGATAVAATVAAIRARTPEVAVETLVSDFQGDDDALAVVFAAGPDVFNHKSGDGGPPAAGGTAVGRLCPQPVGSRSGQGGRLTTKSSLIVGMGETHDEVVQALADLRAVGTDIVTIGQYLRPTSHHLPVAVWWPPDAFVEWKRVGESLGIGHVEASPLTRSSYHAREAAHAARPVAAQPLA